MADAKTGTKIIFGVVLLGVLKLLFTVIKQFVRVTANVLVYFGLYVPFFYLLWGVVLSVLGAFSFAAISINSILFYVGLALCLGVSVCIFVRNYGRKPMSAAWQGSGTAIRSAANPLRRHPARKRQVDAADRPMYVYYSEDNPTLLIHEYSDHFDVYIDDRVHPIRYSHREEKQAAAEA